MPWLSRSRRNSITFSAALTTNGLLARCSAAGTVGRAAEGMSESDAEARLQGGNLTGVVRIGETVRRAPGPWTPAVHALLRHLEYVGFTGSPRALGMDEGAVRVAVHRLRKRYRELLRDEIAQTLVDPAQADEELRSLQAALAP